MGTFGSIRDVFESQSLHCFTEHEMLLYRGRGGEIWPSKKILFTHTVDVIEDRKTLGTYCTDEEYGRVLSSAHANCLIQPLRTDTYLH